MLRGAQRGMALLALIGTMAILAIGCERIFDMAARQAQREREAQLLRVGAAYARALRAWHDATPGTTPRWPGDLAELLEDRRWIYLRRHLRALYGDPVSAGGAWGLLRASDGGIRGVHSTSTQAPLNQSTIRIGAMTLAPAQRYSDWHFTLDDGPR